MPIYTVEHNGKVFDIEGPAGATAEQLQKAIAGGDAPKAVTPGDVGKTMEEQTTSDVGTALKTGIANAASRAVRGIGTTLLPKAAEKWAEQRGLLPTEQDIALLEQGTQASGAAQAANLVGEVALTAAPGVGGYRAATAAARGLPAVRRLVGNRYGSAVVGGAGAGAAASQTMGGDPVEGATVGAILGPAGTFVGDVGGAVLRRARNLYTSPEQLATRRLHEFSANPQADAATLRGLAGEVPGEMPTAGMAATVDPRMLYMKELEEQGRRRLGGEFAARDIANQEARAATLEPLAFRATRYPGEQLSEAEALRRQVTQPLYAGAAENRVALTPELEEILAGADIQAAARRGATSFRQGQTNAAAGGRRVPQGAAPGEAAPFPRDTSTGATMGAGEFMPTPATRSVADLQRLKFELDKQIETLARGTDSASVVRTNQLREARAQLVNEMEQQSGMFGLANRIFRNYSAPQNQGQVANELLAALRNPAGSERATTFLAAMENAPRTLRRADQSARFQHLQDVMTPDQMATINALRRSVQREADYANLPRMSLPGMRSPAEEAEGMIPPFLSRFTTAARSILRRIGATTDDQVERILDEAALDPSRMATLLEQLPPSDRIPVLSAIRERNPRGASIGIMAPTNEEDQ